MTDGQTLFAVFALLYLVECLRLTPSSAWMAAGGSRSLWRVIRPWSRLHVAGGSPLLLSAMPPLQAHALALPWPFIPGQDALLVKLGGGMTAHVAWGTLQPRVEEAMLHLDAATRTRMPSEALAEIWKVRLEDWRGMTAEERRSAFLKHTRTTLDTKAAAASATAVACHTRMLRITATAHFMGCFGVLSVLYHRHGDSPIVLITLGALLLLQFAQSWLFLRVTRRLKIRVPHRRWRALGIALLPQLTMRAADVICLTAEGESPHPLAWRALLGDKAWLPHARQFWREARYVPGWTQNEALPLEAVALHAFFRHEKTDETEYDPAPGSTLPFCPRCHAEYQTGVTTCADCGGLELRNPVG